MPSCFIVYNTFFTLYHTILQYSTPDAFLVLYGEYSTEICFDLPTQSSLRMALAAKLKSGGKKEGRAAQVSVYSKAWGESRLSSSYNIMLQAVVDLLENSVYYKDMWPMQPWWLTWPGADAYTASGKCSLPEKVLATQGKILCVWYCGQIVRCSCTCVCVHGDHAWMEDYNDASCVYDKFQFYSCILCAECCPREIFGSWACEFLNWESLC